MARGKAVRNTIHSITELKPATKDGVENFDAVAPRTAVPIDPLHEKSREPTLRESLGRIPAIRLREAPGASLEERLKTWHDRISKGKGDPRWHRESVLHFGRKLRFEAVELFIEKTLSSEPMADFDPRALFPKEFAGKEKSADLAERLRSMLDAIYKLRDAGAGREWARIRDDRIRIALSAVEDFCEDMLDMPDRKSEGRYTFEETVGFDLATFKPVS